MGSPFSAEENPQFQPAMRLISAITQANPAVVTTTFDHDYRTGDIVRIRVPRQYGMTQLDKVVSVITVTGTDTFSIAVDTSGYDTFVIPGTLPAHTNSTPHVVPIGEINANLGGAVQDVL